MTATVFTFLFGFFRQIWSLFTSWHIPGTNLTPAETFFFFVIAYFFIRLFRTLFDAHGE